MADLCSSCGVEPAKPRMRVCRFCDTSGWRPTAPREAAAEPAELEAVSLRWEIIASVLLWLSPVFVGVLLLVFREALR